MGTTNRGLASARRRMPRAAGRLLTDRLLLLVLALAALAAPALAPAAASASAEREEGQVLAFGKNAAGQLGAGFEDSFEESPVTVLDLSGVVEVSEGYNFSLARLANGKVASWGRDDFGQLGYKLAEGTNEPLPQVIPNLSGVKQVAAAGAHAMALLSNGSVMTWGVTQAGEGGIGVAGVNGTEGTALFAPVRVPTLGNAPETDVKEIAAGGASDYALLEDREMVAWGENNDGQLGSPKPVKEEEKACGTGGLDKKKWEKGHSAGLCPLLCYTEVGVKPCHTEPEYVHFVPGRLNEVEHISAGEESTYAQRDGKLWAWGNNGHAQLGTGTEPTHVNDYPLPVDEFGEVAEIKGGSDFALALLKSGKVFAWGGDGQEQLGRPGRYEEGKGVECEHDFYCIATPEEVPNLPPAESIAAGYTDSFAIAGHEIYGWGDNRFGQLGIGSDTIEQEGTPKPIGGTAPVSQVSAAQQQTLALLKGSTAPPPSYTVTPGPLSLAAQWTFAAPETGEYNVRVNPQGTRNYSQLVHLPSTYKHYEWTGLSHEPYDVHVSVKVGGKIKDRIIVATPCAATGC